VVDDLKKLTGLRTSIGIRKFQQKAKTALPQLREERETGEKVAKIRVKQGIRSLVRANRKTKASLGGLGRQAYYQKLACMLAWRDAECGDRYYDYAAHKWVESGKGISPGSYFDWIGKWVGHWINYVKNDRSSNEENGWKPLSHYVDKAKAGSKKPEWVKEPDPAAEAQRKKYLGQVISPDEKSGVKEWEESSIGKFHRYTRRVMVALKNWVMRVVFPHYGWTWEKVNPAKDINWATDELKRTRRWGLANIGSHPADDPPPAIDSLPDFDMLISPDGKMGWRVAYNTPYKGKVDWSALTDLMSGDLSYKPYIRSGDKWDIPKEISEYGSSGPHYKFPYRIYWGGLGEKRPDMYVVCEDLIKPLWAYQLKKEPWNGEPFLKPEELTSQDENANYPTSSPLPPPEADNPDVIQHVDEEGEVVPIVKKKPWKASDKKEAPKNEVITPEAPGPAKSVFEDYKERQAKTKSPLTKTEAKIVEEHLKDPKATQQVIADRAGSSRPYVSVCLATFRRRQARDGK
jgi:hypothetical protein